MGLAYLQHGEIDALSYNRTVKEGNVAIIMRKRHGELDIGHVATFQHESFCDLFGPPKILHNQWISLLIIPFLYLCPLWMDADERTARRQLLESTPG